MTACRYCGHDPEPTRRTRALDPNWKPCPICRGSQWKTTINGTTKCVACDHGYVPQDPNEPAPLPNHKPIPGLPAKAKAALTKDHPA